MKKITNINFQGRIIPIEETAYDILKRYVESLRSYFANEEGHDEIIGDIENRIAELFSARLKNTVCIADEDVNAVITSIGRPEDFEEEHGPANTSNAGEEHYQKHTGTETQGFYRSKNDKVLGGVCSGLATYLKIDPAIVRILFALCTLAGFGLGVVLYIVLWIILPSKTLVTTAIRKRLFRNAEDYMIGGVASGLATYFNIKTWVARLIFCLPFISGILSSGHFGFWFSPFHSNRLFAGLSGTVFIIYIILWIILPKARSATDKLEMRGEEINLETIKNTRKQDLPYTETPSLGRRMAHATGVLFKAILILMASCISFILISALIAMIFGGVAGGMGVFPFENFIIETPFQHILVLCGIILFMCIPAIALVTWIIRRTMKIKSKRPYLRYIFGSLWIVGIISIVTLAVLIGRNFKVKQTTEEAFTVSQPSAGKFYLKTRKEGMRHYRWHRERFDNDDLSIFGEDNDSLFIDNPRLDIVRSNDSLYHIYLVKSAHGSTRAKAIDAASLININIIQEDSLLWIPRKFAISSREKFRNQQALIVIEVPVGKKIELDENIDLASPFNSGFNPYEWDEEMSNLESNREYIMTIDGLNPTKKNKFENRSL